MVCFITAVCRPKQKVHGCCNTMQTIEENWLIAIPRRTNNHGCLVKYFSNNSGEAKKALNDIWTYFKSTKPTKSPGGIETAKFWAE